MSVPCETDMHSFPLFIYIYINGKYDMEKTIDFASNQLFMPLQ